MATDNMELVGMVKETEQSMNGISSLKDDAFRNSRSDKVMTVETDEEEEKSEEKDFSNINIIYGIMDNPPLHVTLVCALQVASRRVFFFTGVLYIIFGLFGKFSAFFITMPYPILGGALVVLFGILYGIIVSNLEVTKMSSPRNIAIFGLSIFLGLMVPMWVQKMKTPFHTGNEGFDKLGAMLLGNPTLVGTILAVVLDNTVPGTLEERGIAAWQMGDEDSSKLDPARYNEGYEVYQPLIPGSVLHWPVVKYLPILPYRGMLTLILPLTTIAPYANSLDPDETPSNSASHPDPSCLRLGQHFQQF